MSSTKYVKYDSGIFRIKLYFATFWDKIGSHLSGSKQNGLYFFGITVALFLVRYIPTLTDSYVNTWFVYPAHGVGIKLPFLIGDEHQYH